MKERNTVEKGSISAECKREVQDPAVQLIGARAEFFPASARDQWC